MAPPPTAISAVLFTDIVESTGLMQRLGDERAQGVFDGHRRMLRDALGVCGGEELQWLGDGQMASFASPADAVRCAIAMQQGAVRPLGGERLRIRVGLNAGELIRDPGGNYFGIPVVTARRLCDSAQPGQILCTSTVAGLLAGRRAFRFADVGPQTLKGLADPVGVVAVEYDAEEPAAFLATTPFVGRDDEMGRLAAVLAKTRAGEGNLVMLVGEPGIGKTRAAEELAELARRDGARVLWGRCYEGEWAPPYGAFVEAIEAYARTVSTDELRADVGYGAPPLARLVPSLRERLGDVPEPVLLQADEERFRLLDAVSLLLAAAAERAPLVLVLDDLHWADRDTIAMLRQVARTVARHRVLILGLYRDVDLDRQHPLADALGALRREAPYERIVLRGLDSSGVGALLEAVARHDVNPALVRAISEETSGNPFFIREVLAHLVEEGKLYREGGRWKSGVARVEELGIPESVRQVVTRRLARLSEAANRLLSTASAFQGAFRFDLASMVMGLEEAIALDALDEALAAQLLRATGEADTYDFTHALIRHTLYAELNPSRQVRLHRRLAEAMERLCPDRAADIAYHFHRSAAVSGAERGVPYALAAADRAKAAYAGDDVVTFLRMALELLPAGDSREAHVRARLGHALIGTLAFDEALAVAREASGQVAEVEGIDAATD
ncbi:MAG: ATP-binding protein, partial [Candidatus Binatia bacterium]